MIMVSREICWSKTGTSRASDPGFKPAAEFIRARKRNRKDQQPTEENDSNVDVRDRGPPNDCDGQRHDQIPHAHCSDTD